VGMDPTDPGSQHSSSLHEKPDRWKHPTTVSHHFQKLLASKRASTVGNMRSNYMGLDGMD
jgi:hypothetical protein